MNKPLSFKQYNYDSIEAGYYDKIFRKASGVQSKWHALKFKRIRREMDSFERHLDIGCGPGTFIGSLDENGFSVGVDIAKEQIYYATQNYGKPNRQFLPVAGGCLPFTDASFNVVTLIEVIEHLALNQIRELLSEVFRVTIPGGMCFVTTPNYAGLWPLLEWSINRRGKINYEEQHVSHFTSSRLKFIIQAAGFKHVTVEGFQGVSFAFAKLHWKLADLLDKLPISIINFLLLAKGVKSK